MKALHDELLKLGFKQDEDTFLNNFSYTRTFIEGPNMEDSQLFATVWGGKDLVVQIGSAEYESSAAIYRGEDPQVALRILKPFLAACENAAEERAMEAVK